jgi:hypothetical protein
VNIHQLSINYLHEPDRILARINTTDGKELRLWFTRRLTLGFMPMLNNAVAQWISRREAAQSALISPAATADLPTQRLWADFKRSEALQKADLHTPYQAPSDWPLGSEPLLITQVQVTPLDNGQLQVGFIENLSPPTANETDAPAQAPAAKPPRSFRMALEPALVHGFVHLMDKAIAASQWTFISALPVEASAAVADEARPRYLN